VEDELVAWGHMLRLETRGRVTGRPVFATIGFVETDGGVLFVAAGSHAAHWANNLLADPDARATVAERSFRVRARELSGPEKHRAVAALILRYGTPAERLGAAAAFALERVPAGE